MDNYLFQAICVRVSDEKDPKIVELFKQRLRLLLSEETPEPLERQTGEAVVKKVSSKQALAIR